MLAYEHTYFNGRSTIRLTQLLNPSGSPSSRTAPWSSAHQFLLAVFLFIATPLYAEVSLQSVVSGLTRPVFMADPNDGSGRLMIVEQVGLIRIFKDGVIDPTPFLDIRSKVSTGFEQGLLGFAFDPRFRRNGRVFINYTREDGATVVSSFTVDRANTNVLDPASERFRIRFPQPYANHNGGHIAFGKDGLLYISSGDGGSANDPLGNGQSLTTLLGKILRIDVSGPRSYEIPSTNPFVRSRVKGVRREIYAYGLRNPWRFSFDRSNGRLFAGDVGQNAEEEVNIIVAGGNYGWKITEGNLCFDPPTQCNRRGLRAPIASYGRSEGQSVTGGYVYRGKSIPQLVGKYVFADFLTGTIFTLTRAPGGAWVRDVLFDTERYISSFAEDRDGELFLVDYAGEILRFVP
jgi:glucose/arabinose dehydrogenase